MIQTTTYLAPFSLWLCVRRHYCRDGTLFVEPAWIGSGEHMGPALFVSRLHAHIYAALRNRYHPDDDDSNWLCTPLHAFGLREHIRDMGGTVNCEMVFGFATDADGALILVDGTPCMRFHELGFELGEHVTETSFSFDQWVFEFMRAEWASIGAWSYEATFDRIDGLDDIALARMLDAALAKTAWKHGMDDSSHWAVYDPGAGRWIGAPICAPVRLLTLH